jgi:uncharacterized membrane protein YkgB
MNSLVRTLIKLGILKEDLHYHLIRASKVIIFLFFGYQKWWAHEAQRLIPYISNGPLLFWLYPVFGVRGASLGSCEWTFGTLLFLGFWNKRLGILGALGSCATFIGTVTIIPFMPDGWDASAGGFPAMTGNVPFLMKDYLLKHDVGRVSLSSCGRAKLPHGSFPVSGATWSVAAAVRVLAYARAICWNLPPDTLLRRQRCRRNGGETSVSEHFKNIREGNNLYRLLEK